jgi:hypothetical protein
MEALPVRDIEAWPPDFEAVTLTADIANQKYGFLQLVKFSLLSGCVSARFVVCIP